MGLNLDDRSDPRSTHLFFETLTAWDLGVPWVSSGPLPYQFGGPLPLRTCEVQHTDFPTIVHSHQAMQTLDFYRRDGGLRLARVCVVQGELLLNTLFAIRHMFPFLVVTVALFHLFVKGYAGP